MSDPNIPSAQPVGYVPLDYTPTRPTSVTVLSIIGIVLAVLSLVVCFPMQFASFVVPQMGSEAPGMIAIKNSTPAFAFTLANGAISILITIMLLICSIGSLKLFRWARQGMIAYAILTIITAIVGTILQFILIFPITLAPENLPPGTPANALGMAKVAAYIFTVLIVVIVLVLPICILIFFNRPHVKDAFERRMTL